MDAVEALDAQSQPTFAAATTGAKDPRKIARKYQLELCKRAMEENVIVYLETGCGKTHIAVLLIYELGHLIRKPQKSVCVFLAPTVHLVRQQATVIEDSTDFKVGSYVGNSRHLKNHHDWAKEIEQLEILVMTPQVLLRNLEHCFIRMELIALLIFDECHHAQTQSRHPYAQILKEFYKNSTTRCPRIFGMTASPIVGKGGSSQADYSKSINSLENLLDAKVYTVEDREELESLVASPNMKVYFYGPVVNSASSLSYHRKLEDIKNEVILDSRGKIGDLKKIKLLLKAHEKLVFCLENLGLCGGRQAAQMLLSNHCEVPEMEPESSKNDSLLEKLYLTQVPSVFNFSFVEDGIESDYFHPEALEEPFFSKKLLLLIQILSGHRLQEDKKCIVFVKRVIVAKSLAFILDNLETLKFWKSEFLVGVHCKKMKNMSRGSRNETVEKFRSGKVNLLVATNVAEEGLDIPTCCLVIRFDLPESVTSFIQSRGRARMQQSEYVFLVERENQHEIKLINDFTYNENRMNKEISSRTCDEKFDNLEERRYKVNKTGASISTGSCVSLLHHYCSKLPRDEYYTPTPDVFYIDDLRGTVCRIILPPNAPIRQVESQPSLSKDEAKRNACLKACEELHALGCLTDFLLPGQDQEEGSVEKTIKSDGPEDDSSRGELHEMLIPSALRVPWTGTEIPVSLNFYFIKLTPVPVDRTYIDFGFFVKSPLPKEAETMSVDLHLAHGRIVKAEFIPSGIIEFEKDEITHAQNFQEMWLKIVDITDRNEFFSDFVPLGGCASAQRGPSTSYLLLPVKNNVNHDKMIVDWDTMRGCLSSPVFRCPTATDRGVLHLPKTLEFADGAVDIREIPNSLVATSHNKLLFCVVDILYETNGYTLFKDSEITYMEHFKSLNIELSHPEQPLLKAKQLFNLHNLLYNRLQKNRGAREQMEHFVELPPEVCSFKIIGFSKYIASTLSLLPSIMHRLENLLVAIELKDMLSVSFPEGSEISANRVLEALTTEKCSERFSLERLEVLGDAFLKYAVGRHLFLSYESLDEGKLTGKRSSTVNNSHLCELAIKNNLQVYIRDQLFDPDRFFALGHPCRIICTKDTEKMVHFSNGSGQLESGSDPLDVRCNRNHHWLHRKTIADVVEALVGAYIVDSGFKAAMAFLIWIGIQVDFKISDVSQVYLKSECNMSLLEVKNIDGVEILLGYKFVRKGLLLQAFTHPSYNKHSGGCYQRLEFLGDAVLDYLITSYLYSAYPDLKPGQLTDLRSMIVNNKSFAHVAVSQSFQSYLISDSSRLTKDINKFANFVQLSNPEREEPRCPKVLGDLVESCVGAVLLDTGFDLKRIWTVMLNFLHPIMKFSELHLSPIRELREFCQSEKFEIDFPSKKTDGGTYQVEAVIDIKGKRLTGTGININKKTAEKMASQDALRELKAQGYRFKTKSLEEIVRVSRRDEAKLIGYDETPIIVDAPIPIQLEKLQEAEDVASSSSPISSSSTTSNGNSTTYNKALIKGSTATPKRVGRHPRGLDGESTWINDEQTAGTPYKGSAKSRLHEICAANYWKQPSFLRCKEEGPSHMKLFTYKVTVEIEDATPIILEGFSEPRLKKKAAKEHAAEGALWYLRHLGY